MGMGRAGRRFARGTVRRFDLDQHRAAKGLPPTGVRGLLQDRDRNRVTVDQLANLLQASKETIRRDLTELAERGIIRKVHGGATTLGLSLPADCSESPFALRLQANLRAKRAIARKAASLFGADDTLFIDAGSTTLYFAEELARRPSLTVITNSIAIVGIIARAGAGHRSFLIGGEYREEVGETVGALTVEQIRRFHAAHAVLTVGAIESGGIMDYDLGEAEVARAMVAQARSVTVIADSSKFGRAGLFQVGPLEAIDRLVTERAPERTIGEALLAAGVDIIVPDDDCNGAV
jgi:DeoR/GlpR family transcriptional regulator of sugar metabolism